MSAPAHGSVPLMTPEHASRLLDHVVYERVREVVDFCSLLYFEQELWGALRDMGFSREQCPIVSAELVARALTRIGEDRTKLASDFDNPPLTPD